MKKQTNTGKTHFKKGYTPWNKGLKLPKRPNQSKLLKKMWDSGKFKNRKINYKETAKKISATQQGISYNEWNGFTTSILHRLRNDAKYNIWRNKVFLRDKFTCKNKDCKFCNNEVGVFLHAHHIKSFAKYPKLRFNINNGITYCAGFHLKSNLHLNTMKGGKDIMKENIIIL